MRHIVGVQIHHSTYLNDAIGRAANVCADLRGALTLSGNPEIEALLLKQGELCQEISNLATKSREVFNNLRDTDIDRFVRCRDGLEAWPDETIGTFVPRCSCNDACPIHDRGWEDQICNCDETCPAHTEV